MIPQLRTLAIAAALMMLPTLALAQGRHHGRHAPAPAPEPTPATTLPEAPPAAEEPSANESDDAAARLLYERGAEALTAGEYQTALDRFQQAYDLSHRAVLLYNIGTTLDRLRRDRQALAAFQQFLDEVPEHPRRAEVVARVAALTTAIAEEDRVQAEAEERARLDREENARRTVEAEAAAEQARLDREAAERRAADANDGLPPAVVISVGSAAVVAGVLGIVFGVRTRTLNDDYQQLAFTYGTNGDGLVVNPQQAAEVRSANNDAHAVQRITNIAYFSSAALAAGAITLIFFTDWNGNSDEPVAMPRTLPVMTAGPGGGVFGIQHRF